LDGNLKSKREKTGSDFQTWRLEKAEQPEHKQPPVFDSAIGREHPESREDLELQNASREAAGALIASKMRKREQGKRKIRSEWDDASSFLWKNGEKDERYPTNGILSSDDSERTESRVAGAKHDAPQSAHRDHGGRSAESEELRKSIEAAKELCGSPLEPSPPKRMIPIILLPLSALVALLLAEVTYYSPGFAGFLNNILPLSMQAWVVFVILALGLGLASGVSAFRHLNRYGREANSD